MNDNKALEEKFRIIENAMEGQDAFFMDEIEALFPELKRSTLYWTVSKMAEAGLLKRVRRGMYCINRVSARKSIAITEEMIQLWDVLDLTGAEYYISGIDVLSEYMPNVPMDYPVIVFTEKSKRREVAKALHKEHYKVSEPAGLSQVYEERMETGNQDPILLLYPTDNFDYAENGMASLEKAFIDLYYAVTRNKYPLSVQELVKTYENLTRTGIADRKRMITIAARRSIQYDIRFIVESKHITNDALHFVEIMKRSR